MERFGELGSADADGLDEAAEGVFDEQCELVGEVLGVALDFLDLLQQPLVVGESEEVPGLGVFFVVLDAFAEEAEHQVEAFVALFGELLGEPGAELAAVLGAERGVDADFEEETLVAVVDLLFVEVVLLEESLEVEEVVLGRVGVLLVCREAEPGELELEVFADVVAEVVVAFADGQSRVLDVHVEQVDLVEEQTPHGEDLSPDRRALFDRVQPVRPDL